MHPAPGRSALSPAAPAAAAIPGAAGVPESESLNLNLKLLGFKRLLGFKLSTGSSLAGCTGHAPIASEHCILGSLDLWTRTVTVTGTVP